MKSFLSWLFLKNSGQLNCSSETNQTKLRKKKSINWYTGNSSSNDVGCPENGDGDGKPKRSRARGGEGAAVERYWRGECFVMIK